MSGGPDEAPGGQAPGGDAPRGEGVARFAPTWQARRVEAADGVPGAPLPEAFVCVACGGAEVTCAGSGSWGTVAGGERWFDVVCAGCGAVTEYSHAWG